MSGNVSMLISVGVTRDAPPGHLVDHAAGQPGAVLDRVDPGGDQPGQRVLAEHVHRDPGAELRARGRPRRPARRPARAGPGRPASRSIQSPTSLTQPSPRPACSLDRGDQPVRLDLDADVAQVALRPGDVPAGPHQPGQVGAAAARTGCPPASRRRGAAARRRPGRRAPARPSPPRTRRRPASCRRGSGSRPGRARSSPRSRRSRRRPPARTSAGRRRPRGPAARRPAAPLP